MVVHGAAPRDLSRAPRANFRFRSRGERGKLIARGDRSSKFAAGGQKRYLPHGRCHHEVFFRVRLSSSSLSVVQGAAPCDLSQAPSAATKVFPFSVKPSPLRILADRMFSMMVTAQGRGGIFMTEGSIPIIIYVYNT